MDFLTFLLLLSSILLISYKILANKSKLPPGPFPLPIIGNIFQLGPDPHVSLYKLSKTYGPIMHLKFGSITTIVASSPEMAKQILLKHDEICCGRIVPYAVEALNHHEASVGWLPVGSKWRKFRKVSKENVFTMHKMETTEDLRQEKVQQMRKYLEKCCASGRVVDVGEVALNTTLNLLSATMFSFDIANFDSTAAHEIMEIIKGSIKVSSMPNIADYFPVLKFIDPKGIKKKTEFYYEKLFAIFDDIIRERLQSKKTSMDTPRKKDLLEVLLDLNQQDDDSELSLNDIKNLLLDLIGAGTHTTAESVECAMAELVYNPEKMVKVKSELKSVIGEKKQVEESDIPKLPYLNAVIKESLRLHPPGVFLVPHKAETDVEINGYMIPKDARILVNAWAIGRHPSTWSNPESFEPERFLGSKVDYKGHDFELIPFGSGRRICPGLPLAHLMLHLMVATLVHNFDWKLEEGGRGIKPEELNMNDTIDRLHKMLPLKAFPMKN